MKEKANEKLVLTYSRMSSYLTCPTLEYYQYRAGGCGIEGTEPYLPFIEGEFLHYALHHWYKSQRMLRDNLIRRITKKIDEVKELGGGAGLLPEVDDKLRVSLTAMVGACLGYKDRYRTDFTQHDVVLTEAPFRVEMQDLGIFLEGKIDLLTRTRDKDKKLVLWEHKAVGDVAQDSYVALPLSFQDMVYCLGVEQLTGDLPDLTQRNYILKSRLRRKGELAKSNLETLPCFEARVLAQYMEEPDKKFFRPPPLRVLPVTVECVMEHLNKLITQFRGGFDETPLMNFTSCLGMYGQACRFVPACVAKMQKHADGWNAPECQGLFRPKKLQHPELKVEKEEEEEDGKAKDKTGKR